MTDREIMQKALEALEEPKEHIAKHRRLEAITALRERLAQPEQEPLAWLHRDSWGTLKLSQTMPPPVGAFPVYTAPQQEPVIDKAAAIRIATVLGWEPPREEQEPTVKWDASAPLVVTPHPAFQATPQRREWVGLTKEEAKEISMANRPYVVDMIAALEARLKEKNT